MKSKSFGLLQRISGKLILRAVGAEDENADVFLDGGPIDKLPLADPRPKSLMARVLRRLGIKSDTGTLQTESRSRSEEVLRLSMSKATWTASLQDPAAH